MDGEGCVVAVDFSGIAPSRRTVGKGKAPRRSSGGRNRNREPESRAALALVPNLDARTLTLETPFPANFSSQRTLQLDRRKFSVRLRGRFVAR